MRTFESFLSLACFLHGILLLGVRVGLSRAFAASNMSMRLASSAAAHQCKGSAANPMQKRRVAVIGTGGYLGSLTFGFLQRASSLFGTGIGNVRSIGATADTAVRMNRVLSKNFCLAVADESYIKLTDLQNVEDIRRRLDGWDALIIGNDLHLTYRPVTANTFEKTPNDKTYEVYWDAPRGLDLPFDSTNPLKDTIIQKVITAAQSAGIQHLVAVDNSLSPRRMMPLLESSSIPYTVILHGPTVDTHDYTYRKGVQGRVSVTEVTESDLDALPAPPPMSSMAREDLAALCVQSLLSLDWSKSRCLQVSGAGASLDSLNAVNGKRPDQEWCVNSHLLEESLQTIE